MGSFLGLNGTITDGSGMMAVMTKLLKQELASDAEEEGLVPALSGRFTSMQKVPSVSDLSDPESSLGESSEHSLSPFRSLETRFFIRHAHHSYTRTHTLARARAHDLRFHGYIERKGRLCNSCWTV